MIKPQTLKGFRDFLPEDALKRQFLVSKIKGVFKQFGYDPLETPALEYADTLLGKYGEEADKLLYIFEDRGGRKVGLRYDQTVPAARVVAQYSDLPKPFKRYQIQPVWRAENTQKGRYREFMQCDADIYGEMNYLADAEIITLAAKVVEKLGFEEYTIIVNDRLIFGNIPASAIISIDKLNKIGEVGVKEELKRKNLDPQLLDTIRNNKPSQFLSDIVAAAKSLGIGKHIRFDPTLARGLDYYTSSIFEVVIDGYSAGSVCGGGRYDKLIGQFIGKDVPAVGFAFGFDRLLEASEQFSLLPKRKTSTQVLVTIFSPELLTHSLQLTTMLRNSGICTDVYYDDKAKLDKQLKYADRKGIPYTVIVGPEEVAKNVVKLKDLRARSEVVIASEKLVETVKKLTKSHPNDI